VINLKIQAAVVREKSQPFTIEELELESPRADEVVVRIVATGLCHTDLVVRDQYYPVPLPVVLGHEGAGVVDQVGDRVTKVKPGDRVC
jgi:aryl-alcohol dehydrogenase